MRVKCSYCKQASKIWLVTFLRQVQQVTKFRTDLAPVVCHVYFKEVDTFLQCRALSLGGKLVASRCYHVTTVLSRICSSWFIVFVLKYLYSHILCYFHTCTVVRLHHSISIQFRDFPRNFDIGVMSLLMEIRKPWWQFWGYKWKIGVSKCTV